METFVMYSTTFPVVYNIWIAFPFQYLLEKLLVYSNTFPCVCNVFTVAVISLLKTFLRAA
jgi:hypothetical protein